MYWQDLQETFILTLGPYILGLLLPLFGAAGIFLAILMALSRFWRPLEKIVVIWAGRD